MYEDVDGGVKIVVCWLKDDENAVVVIPNQIDGKDVIELDKELFIRDNYKAVVLNKNLKAVSSSCFLDAEIEKVFPDYKKCNKWLRDNGSIYLNRLL